jgi:hypothetical protein
LQDDELAELIAQAAAEVKRLNPHISDPAPTLTEQECEEIAREDQALAELWNTPEGLRAQQLGFSAADSISEDRGR